MPWPKGKSRKVQAESAPTSSVAAAAKRVNMKPPTDWTSPAGDPLAKFKNKSARWEDHSADDLLSIEQDVLDKYRREGIVFQWQPRSVYGDEKVCSRMLTNMQRNGWEIVTPDDLKNMPGIPACEVDGLVLMAAPRHVDDQARDNDRRAARAATDKVAHGLKEGVPGISMPGGANHPSALRHNKVRRTIEPLGVPTDE